MLRIGITGGIGSGKTIVCNIFKSLGVHVFNSDVAAKLVMNSDELLKAALKRSFGEDTYFPNGELNRKYLSDKVFNNSSALQKLNSLVHPAAIRAFDDWAANMLTCPYILKEAAILFESGSYKGCDYTVLVTGPENLRIKRVMQRDHISEAQVRARIDKQMPDCEKEKLSDFIIYNDEKTALLPQVLKLHNLFLRLSEKTD